MFDTSEGTYAALRSAPRRNLRDIIPLPGPFTVFIEPTNVCNFKCSYCPVHFDDYLDRVGGHSKLSLTDCSRIFDEMLTLGKVKTLNFYMLGEPFANRDLPTMIEMAKQRDVAERTIVTTNATLLNEDIAKRTIASGLDFLRVSVYGATQKRHADVTASKIPLERVYENVARFRRLRDAEGSRIPHIYAKMIDSGDPTENALFIERFSQVCDEVQIEPAMNWNVALDEADLSGFGNNLGKSDYLSKEKKACPFPFYTLVINANLSVSVCCVDWERKAIVGNLKKQSLAEIWRGDALREFQLTHLGGRRSDIDACKSCTYIHTAPDNIDNLSPADYLKRSMVPALITEL